jgi:hypothetical protein
VGARVGFAVGLLGLGVGFRVGDVGSGEGAGVGTPGKYVGLNVGGPKVGATVGNNVGDRLIVGPCVGANPIMSMALRLRSMAETATVPPQVPSNAQPSRNT